MSLFSPSGGLLYHARALRYRGSLWAPFRAELAAWLAAQLPVTEPAILVGPSAGHCLPLDWLGQLPEIWALEPDPVARWLLARGLKRRPRFESRDLLLGPLLADEPGLETLLNAEPSASVVFCNVLGQLHFDLSDAEHERFQAQFQRRITPLLDGRSWASFHDRWSYDAGLSEASPSSLSFDRQPDDRQLGDAWFGAVGPRLTVLDHGTQPLFDPALPREYFAWQIGPKARHVIEAVARSRPASLAR